MYWVATTPEGDSAVLDDIRTKARRTLEDIFPNADVAALSDVVHPECFNHELPPGMPQGLEGMQQVMLWLNRAFSDAGDRIDFRPAFAYSLTLSFMPRRAKAPPNHGRVPVRATV